MAQGVASDEIRRIAAELGLTRLSEEHLHTLERAMQAARARAAKLPFGDLGYADEPAHVFTLEREGES
jgi:hypothetical protein